MKDVEALRELIDERDRRYEQRFIAQEIAAEKRFIGQQENVKDALISVNERLKGLNELRSGVATSAELAALEKLFNVMANRIQVLETTRAAGQAQVRSIYAAIAAAVGLIGLIVLFANGKF